VGEGAVVAAVVVVAAAVVFAWRVVVVVVVALLTVWKKLVVLLIVRLVLFVARFGISVVICSVLARCPAGALHHHHHRRRRQQGPLVMVSSGFAVARPPWTQQKCQRAGWRRLRLEESGPRRRLG
jgi:hypothetical protein